MRILRNPSPSVLLETLKRPTLNLLEIKEQVRTILGEVRNNGDRALIQFSQKFDRVELDKFAIELATPEHYAAQLPADLVDAIETARHNIATFHTAQQEPTGIIETMPGVHCWRRSLPLDSVGIYVPGGSAPLLSTALMLAVPAKLAGCQRIVLCTPPQSGSQLVHPAMLYIASRLQIEEVFAIGGAQAIAAMAYGTETIQRVDKVCGPGNIFVTCAKQIVQQEGVPIDMPAGPSEVLIIADETALPSFLAADLLAQAEHGPDSQVILLSPNENLVVETVQEVERQLTLLPRRDIAAAALTHSTAIITNNLEGAMDISNQYAPEHLIIATHDAEQLANNVRHAGSVFIGHYTPEAAGDYASGTNHTLPTNGWARVVSGLSLDSFVKKVTFQKITPEGLLSLAPTIETLAAAETLEAHRRAITIRLPNIKQN